MDFGAYQIEEPSKQMYGLFGQIGKPGMRPIFTISALPFFSPSDLAKITPEFDVPTVGFITKRLSSGIKLLVLIELRYCQGEDLPEHHWITIPAATCDAGLVLL